MSLRLSQTVESLDVDPASAADETAALIARVRQLEAEIADARLENQSLQVGEERLASFVEATNSWFWETGADLRFTYFSPSVFDVTGVRPEWHYGKTREEIGIPDSVSLEAWGRHLNQLKRREPFSDFIFQRNGPDGQKWLRSSGVPYFDADGSFQGYRGMGSDITAQVVAEKRAESLMDAMEELDELFVLWGPDDMLVVCNERFRALNAKVIETTKPGTPFEVHIRTALAAGLYPNAAGREEEWIAERLHRHQNPNGPFEIERQDGLWIQLHEQVLPDGSVITISTDITERKRMEQAILAKNSILESTQKTIPDGLQVLDSELNLIAQNDQLFAVLDLDRDLIMTADNPGKALRYAMAARGTYGPGDCHELVERQEAAAKTKVPVQYECQLVTGKWIECRSTPIEGGGYLEIYRDISESKRQLEELHKLASIDSLTQIPNRRFILETAQTEFERANRYARPFSLLVLDIDHFKSINDTYGHAAGDAVLIGVAQTCVATLRDLDHMGRIGGEEFIVLLPETDETGAALAAERLRAAVADLETIMDHRTVAVTTSIGLATALARHANVEAIIAEADHALYQAKQNGRDRVEIAPSDSSSA